jgi:hypothetical protein
MLKQFWLNKVENQSPVLSFSSLEKERVVGEANILQLLNQNLPADRQVNLSQLKNESALSKVLRSLLTTKK